MYVYIKKFRAQIEKGKNSRREKNALPKVKIIKILRESREKKKKQASSWEGEFDTS